MNWTHRWVEAPSTALLILGTMAKKAGHNVKVIHHDIEAIPDNFYADIIGITCSTFQVRDARALAQGYRDLGCKVVIGGAHAPVWDGVGETVTGAGEEYWADLINGKAEKQLEIDYSLVDLKRFTGISPLIGAVPSMCMMASRGCIGQCTFCNTPVHWGKTITYSEPQWVVEQIERMHKLYGARELFFQDDTFNINHKWAFSVFEGIINKGLNKKMVFRLTGRVNQKLVTEEYLKLAKRAGVWNIFYGIESGSQYMLDRMKKNVTVSEIERAIEMTKKQDIATVCSFIVGLCGESSDTLMETNRLINRIQPDHYGWGYACPFPLTEYRNEVVTNKHILNIDYGDYIYGMLYARTDDLSFEDLRRFRGFDYKSPM